VWLQAEEEQPPADVAPDDGGGGGDNGDVSTAALDAVSDLDYFRMKRGTMKDDDEEEEDGDGDGDGDDDESLHTDSDDEAEAEAEVDAPATNGEAENEDAPSEANEEAAQVAADADDGATANGDARKVGAGGEVVDEASVAETGRLFVRNLPYTCTEEELAQVFQRLGPLTEVHMPLDKETKRPLGFAHIVYMMPEHAVRALEDIDGTIFQACIIRARCRFGWLVA
jgi:multiple RNA-binding domain-containing protein 1